MDELIALIREALDPQADEDVDRSGRSEFDYAREYLLRLAGDGKSNQIVNALISVGSEGSSKDVEWWLSFLDLFEEIREVTPGLGLRLANFLQEHPPKNLEARAYLIRFMAQLDVPISWDNLSGGASVDQIARVAPLVISEALVWNREYTRAKDQLRAALTAHIITWDDLSAMIARWRDVLGATARPFLEELAHLRAPQPHVVHHVAHKRGNELFRERLTKSSRYYPAVAPCQALT
jgi:hypothetical protein